MTIEEGIAKWRGKAKDAVRIGRGVTVSPEWLLELMEWHDASKMGIRELERVGADVIPPFEETIMGKWLKGQQK